MPSDAAEDRSALVERARQGDRSALGELWRTHHPALLRYLRVRVGDALAEDVASTVWLDVARSLHRFQGDAEGFRRWLFTIGRRRTVDELRRRGRRPEALLADTPEPRATPTGTEPLRPGAPGGLDALDGALRLLRLLTPEQAEAVALRVVADLDVAAAAELMGRSETAVRALTHRGLHRLAELAAGGSPTEGNLRPGVTGAAAPTMEGAR